MTNFSFPRLHFFVFSRFCYDTFHTTDHTYIDGWDGVDGWMGKEWEGFVGFRDFDLTLVAGGMDDRYIRWVGMIYNNIIISWR